MGKKIKITVMKTARYDDLIEKYENPIEHACDMREGDTFIADGWARPQGLCESAWESMSPFVLALSCGGEDIYDGWMKNKKSAMISCNDGCHILFGGNRRRVKVYGIKKCGGKTAAFLILQSDYAYDGEHHGNKEHQHEYSCEQLDDKAPSGGECKRAEAEADKRRNFEDDAKNVHNVAADYYAVAHKRQQVSNKGYHSRNAEGYKTAKQGKSAVPFISAHNKNPPFRENPFI